MENADNGPLEPLDALSSASKWSKVSKKNTKNRNPFYWLGGSAFAIMMVLMLSSHHGAGSSQRKTVGMNSTSYSSSLDANLARLRALANQKPAVTVAADKADRPLATAHNSKEMIVRQNAPTSMYASPARHMTSVASSAPMRQATFAGQGANTQFANAHTATTVVKASRILHPNFTLVSGEFLHAVLETAINSDLPGMVRAIVSKPVYAYTGERALIPAGSRLIGQYSSAIAQGQERVMIMWNRVVLPNGMAAQLNSPGSDALGRAGQGADHVNTHFFARFGEAALLSIIGAGAANAGVNNADPYNSASQYRAAIAQSFQQSARQSLQGTLPMKPTIHIYQGAKINVFVAHDLSFYPVLKSVVNVPRPMSPFVK